jgi:hypothetical protein
MGANADHLRNISLSTDMCVNNCYQPGRVNECGADSRPPITPLAGREYHRCNMHAITCFVSLDVVSSQLCGLFLAAPANRPPVATSDTYRTITTTAVEISPMANDTDPDNDTLQFIDWLNAPAFGSLSNLGNGSFRYTPSGSVGVDVLRYNVTDGRLMATGTVTVTVGERMR